MVIVVEIEDRCLVKPFLGGWKNVVTGTEYHDARTQTCLRDTLVYTRGKKQHKDEAATLPPGSCFTRRAPDVITETRDHCVGTDTSVLMLLLAPYHSKYTSVASERATQTSRLPDLRDKFVIPLFSPAHPQITRSTNYHNKTSFITEISRPHDTTDRKINGNIPSDCSRLEVESAMKIQKCYRAYRARVDFGALARLSRETRAQTPPKPDKIHHFRHSRASQFEIVNFVPPSKRSDFELLQSVLERWRFYENSRLNRGFFDTSKLAERARILRREIELLRSIETIKSRVRKERRERRYLDDLDKLAAFEVWKIRNDEKKILVDTLRAQRARECRDFYRSLFNEEIAANDRLEILKKLRQYAAKHTCKYAQDLVFLVDQEIQLFGMNYDEEITNSLRNRLKQALLRLTMKSCSPEKNITDNGTSNLSRTKKTKKCSFSKLCKRCGKFLTIDDLSARIISPSQVLLPTCEDCRKSQPGKDAKIVYEPYDIMIRDLRIRETDLGSSPKNGDPAWIVDSRLIYRLVTYVWHGKSGISECDDLYRLVLVRFRPNKVWSPWNSLLLTKREAALHQSMQDPCEIYAPTIMKKFVVKNLQAKLRFDMNMTTNFL